MRSFRDLKVYRDAYRLSLAIHRAGTVDTSMLLKSKGGRRNTPTF